MHYAALDAQCLPPILKKLVVLAAAEDHADLITLEKFTKPLIFGVKLMVPDVLTDPTEKKDNKKDRKKRKRGPRRKKTNDHDAATDATLEDSEEEKKQN